MFPDVCHQLECGRLRLLVLGQILIDCICCVPRHCKDGDALHATCIVLFSIEGETELLDGHNQLRGDVDVGLVRAEWDVTITKAKR